MIFKAKDVSGDTYWQDGDGYVYVLRIDVSSGIISIVFSSRAVNEHAWEPPAEFDYQADDEFLDGALVMAWALTGPRYGAEVPREVVSRLVWRDCGRGQRCVMCLGPGEAMLDGDEPFKEGK